jgi:thioredoxin reductase/Fe-S-cluster-containing hydrogenase component 2
MKRYDVVIVGAGPAGLSAGIEAASAGMKVVIFDENARPGGQLFKQIHKFFGSKEHRAKERGFRIGEQLLKEAKDLGVEVVLGATVIGLYENKEITVKINDEVQHFHGTSIILATGAAENMLPFKGWTLPGVIGAGAAQTMMNLHGVKPGNKVLMVGSGNVGLVVGYQIIQAGCSLEAIIDAGPKVGGYGVHAAKIARTGVPFYTSYTIKEAYGNERVEGATIVELDSNWKEIPGSEKNIEADTICIAVGLSPMSQLADMAGCEMSDNPLKGGYVPGCNEYGETSIKGIYAAGDIAGIEEASSAMIQGRIAGASVACDMACISKDQFLSKVEEFKFSLGQLREGMFALHNRKKVLEKTDEGFPLSMNLLKKGYVADIEMSHFPGIPDKGELPSKLTPVIECTQNIPCNPCQDACNRGCIKIGSSITRLPEVEGSAECTGCGMCVVSCPGQAIFLVNKNFEPGFASVSLPYEFLPLPEKGAKGTALSRGGEYLGEAEVVKVVKTKASDQTAVLTMKVSEDLAMKARFFKAE